jgi:hypothetical protein
VRHGAGPQRKKSRVRRRLRAKGRNYNAIVKTSLLVQWRF